MIFLPELLCSSAALILYSYKILPFGAFVCDFCLVISFEDQSIVCSDKSISQGWKMKEKYTCSGNFIHATKNLYVMSTYSDSSHSNENLSEKAQIKLPLGSQQLELSLL